MNYCTQEEVELEREIKKNKCFKSKSHQDIWALIVLLLICITGLVVAEYREHDQIEMRGCWGETWECSQCGYENYEGISRCGICGKGRYES